MQSKEVLNFTSEADFFDFAKEQFNHDSSFFMFDLSSLEHQHQRFTSFLPRVTPYYAIKCNPDPMLVKTLYSLGCGLDCASKGELEEALDEVHADPDRIIFANPCKLPEHIRFMKEIGVKRSTFDCEAELIKMKELYPDSELVLRLATNDSKSRMPLSVVYGARREYWEPLVKKCQELGLNLIGVSFHIGSGSSEPSNFYDALKDAAEVFEIAERYGFSPYFLDIGGGFPGITEDKNSLCFEEFAGQVNIGLDEFFSSRKDLKIIAEPGRYFANGSMYSFLKVVSRKVFEGSTTPTFVETLVRKYGIINEDNNCKKEMYDYYVNESTNIFFTILLMEHNAFAYVHLLRDHKGEEKHRSNIYGFSSAENELLVGEVMLPKLEVGEEIYFKNVGAYSNSVGVGTYRNGYTFNDKRYYFTISGSNIASETASTSSSMS